MEKMQLFQSCGTPLVVSVAFNFSALSSWIVVFVATIFLSWLLDFCSRSLSTSVRSVRAESQKTYVPRRTFVKATLESSAGKSTGAQTNLCKTGIKRLISCATQNGKSDYQAQSTSLGMQPLCFGCLDLVIFMVDRRYGLWAWQLLLFSTPFYFSFPTITWCLWFISSTDVARQSGWSAISTV